MIDMHCHILPGIDDGAKDMAESLSLVQLAVEQGVKRIVATPHIQLGRYDNTLGIIEAKLFQLRTALSYLNLDVEVSAGAEIRICPEIMLLVQQNQLPFIGSYEGDNVMLMELPHSHVPPGTDKLINWLMKNGVRPMIAHPERNREFQANPKKIEPFIRQGCLFQLTASVLTGDMGDTSLSLAKKWLLNDVFTIIATDSHSVKRRPPRLLGAFQEASRLLGEEKAIDLVSHTPRLISEVKFK